MTEHACTILYMNLLDACIQQEQLSASKCMRQVLQNRVVTVQKYCRKNLIRLRDKVASIVSFGLHVTALIKLTYFTDTYSHEPYVHQDDNFIGRMLCMLVYTDAK